MNLSGDVLNDQYVEMEPRMEVIDEGEGIVMLLAPIIGVSSFFSAVTLYGAFNCFRSPSSSYDVKLYDHPIPKCLFFTSCYMVCAGITALMPTVLVYGESTEGSVDIGEKAVVGISAVFGFGFGVVVDLAHFVLSKYSKRAAEGRMSEYDTL